MCGRHFEYNEKYREKRRKSRKRIYKTDKTQNKGKMENDKKKKEE